MSEPTNPFQDSVAVANSNYSRFDGRRLTLASSGEPAPPLMRFVHDGLRALVLSDQFTCDGGKSSLRRGTYGFGLYDALDSPVACAGLARDLFSFTTRMTPEKGAFTTYLASFVGPHPASEAEFERLLWQTLQLLHDLDTVHSAWDPSVSADPADPQFSFSFGGVAFFVIGMHAASSRAARRFAWPTLVFNPHRQFEDLRASDRYTHFRDVIRRGELALQGNLNPMLSDHGTRSEAVQYSGRQVGDEWRCPFHSRPAHDPISD
jgi:FPC/CPF motif-containing protein YcgG